MNTSVNKFSKEKVVVATYSSQAVFKIPKEFENLDDKTIVEDWGVKWETLYIKPVGKDWVEIEATISCGSDSQKRPDCEIEDRSNWDIVDSDDDDDDDDKSVADYKCFKCHCQGIYYEDGDCGHQESDDEDSTCDNKDHN